MKKLLFALGLLSMSVTSCVLEIMGPAEQDVRVYPEFFAEQVEPFDSGLKTSLNEDRRLVWSAGDQLAIFQGSSIADKYQVKDSSDGQANASFSIVRDQAGEDDDFFAGVEVEFDTNVALYPYQSGLTCVPVYGAPVDDGEDSVVSYRITDVVFPSVQSYVANSFAEESYMMVSVTSDKSDHNLKFKNVCGAMKLQLKGTAKVRTIELMGNADEPLAGSAVITAYSDGTVPAVSMLSTATKTVTLDCGEGVQLSEDTPTVFMISLPPTAFANGFTATLTAADGSTAQLSTTKANPVNRSKIKSMPACRVAFTPVIPDLSSAIDLSETGSANSYIVSEGGLYKFGTFKGNSSESVGAVASAEVLWESFGTDVTPNVGDLLIGARYEDGYIAFKTADTFKEGNAVIAAKDAEGNILWSWHIWLTDQPEEQVYYNNAGTMMDRNLGATSATPGDVGALGLLYQWGRKDPFLGSSSISDEVEAKSTITWPSAVGSDSINGTIEYAIANPTTFITRNTRNYDWYYTGDSSADNTRWSTSDKEKSIYDPCPSGWRVPDGGDNGVWSTALGSSSSFIESSLYVSTNEGMNFSGRFGSDQTIWYPASGWRSNNAGFLDTGGFGRYWSASPCNNPSYSACYLAFIDNGGVSPGDGNDRAFSCSVRCFKEGLIVEPEAVNLSDEGTANSYIVSEGGAYKFSTVKGNSSESVGAVASAEVLWESFGTDVTPSVGDLIKTASYKDGEITFRTADTFREGNAVIAAKNASGTIIWSWHIWLTDEPQGQVYYNNAGTMMDRNLGATSATPGDVCALGLLYQWGRKDPFLGSSSISSNVIAKSTITWPSPVSTSSSCGTVSYVTANPTTFMSASSSPSDWHYSSRDNTLWTTSDKEKSIYDPCPQGWRVPDGGNVWSTALGSASSFIESSLYSSTNEGINFSGNFGSSSTIWYPASGYSNSSDGGLSSVGNCVFFWSASPYSSTAYNLFFNSSGYVNPWSRSYRADGCSVRCFQE